MSRIIRSIAVILVCMMMFAIMLPGCGSKSTGDDISISDTGKQAASAVDANEKSVDTKTVQDGSTVKAAVTGEKKKVVLVQNNDMTQEYYIKEHDNVIKELQNNGFDSTSMELKEFNMQGEQKKSAEEIVGIIKDFKPDVVIGISVQLLYKQLENSGIPCISNTAADQYVDENGNPKDNITGLYVMPLDMKAKAYEFLNRIAPINGKKAVFVTVDNYFKREDIEKGLKANNIELKDYCESPYVQDYQAAVEKYNKDDEVGWILVGVWPWTMKDGKATDIMKTAKWDITNRKKPSVTYWESAVANGVLCGLGVDIPTLGTQIGKMAVRVLNGENIKDIKAESPEKIVLAINKKTGDDCGIQFPADVLGSSVIYTDCAVLK